ncbi:MAG TPA: tRNA (adenosine(37)-N6)-threonylcarbamoyltransferase complex dimerization subunit type 1 TsaB, partial [Cyclobacteriaceae bacterium]|nr:tRNA (adenosine(37)-N6)-threonylcarbamoyltransferase complex dimerization subunit type 1 TsaB [Cyclobacteriaceae bacterium]
KVIDEQSFADLFYRHTILFLGNGAMKCREIITHPNAHFFDGGISSARHMGKLAFGAYNNGAFADIVRVEPNYLKEFKAKTKMT